MIEFIEWLHILTVNHPMLGYSLIFLGAVFGGEYALFTIGFLSAQGVMPVVPAVLLSFVGSFFPNMFWFALGKTDTVSRLALHRYANTPVSLITRAIEHISKGNHFIALILIKFIVGTPVILVMYANKTRLNFREFLYYETPAILLSLLVLISTGFISGLGFSYLSEIFNNLYAAIGFVLLVILIIIMAQLWIKKKFTREDIEGIEEK